AARLDVSVPGPGGTWTSGALEVGELLQEAAASTSLDPLLARKLARGDFLPTEPGLIIPLYVYPADTYADPAILGLLDNIRRNSAVPAITIINPSNGPGTVVDGNYTSLVRKLRAATSVVAGYVATNYGARPTADV